MRRDLFPTPHEENQSETDITRDRKIGETLSEITGYPLIFTENSTGGYKDWSIDKLKIPAYTIEVGDESLSHPITEEKLPEIYMRNKDVPLTALNLAIEYQKEIDFTSPIVQNITKDKNYERNGKIHTARLQSLLERRNTCWSSHRQR